MISLPNEQAFKQGGLLSACQLPDDHPLQLLLTTLVEEGIGLRMKAVGQGYVQYVSRRCLLCGILRGERFRSGILPGGAYLPACSRCIE